MKDLLKNRQLIAFSAVLISFLILAALGVNMLSSQKKELHQLQEQRKEMALLRDEFLSLQQKIQTVENRKNLTNMQGVLQAVDEVFSSLGLKDKVKSVKNTGKKETKDGIEEDADVSVEKVTMNEMVNIFYRIDHAPMILTVKKVTVKQSFDNPELMNITLILSFLKTK